MQIDKGTNSEQAWLCLASGKGKHIAVLGEKRTDIRMRAIGGS
jgi:hypothetical protein